MQEWWIGILIFIFGYLTCKTFYFIRSARSSLVVLKSAHVIYLSTLIKSIEHLSYSREMVLEQLIKAQKTSVQISSFEMRYEEDVRLFKNRAIDILLYSHPPFFRSMIEFDDWKSAMAYLEENRDSALRFWERESRR